MGKKKEKRKDYKGKSTSTTQGKKSEVNHDQN
jgi:hypothetical protein